MPKDVAPTAEGVAQEQPPASGKEQPSAPPGYISAADLEAKLKEIEEKGKKDIAKLTSTYQKKLKDSENKALLSTVPQDEEGSTQFFQNYGRQAYWENWQRNQLEGTGVSTEDTRLDRTNEFTFLASLNKAIVEDKESELQSAAKEMRESLKGAKEELVAEFKKLAAGAKEESGQTDVETAPLRQGSRDLVAEENTRWDKEKEAFKDTGDQFGYRRAYSEHEKRLAEAERLMARS